MQAAPTNIKLAATSDGNNGFTINMGIPTPDPKIRANALALCPTPNTRP